MYANTAYEALYHLMGLQFQEEIIHWLTSQIIFRAMIVIIFAVAFFNFLLRFASRYLSVFVEPRRTPMSKLFVLILCLIIGVSLLKVDGEVTSYSMTGKTWSDSPFISSRNSSHAGQYRVSLIFKLLSASAEEIARALGYIIDATFKKTNSQMTEPNYFYKAVLGAAAETIEDPDLRADLSIYTEGCIGKALPRFDAAKGNQFLDRYFSRYSEADRTLAQIEISSAQFDRPMNCLQFKESINSSLRRYAHEHSGLLEKALAYANPIDRARIGVGSNYENWITSNLLVNFYTDKFENYLGAEKSTELPGVGGQIFQHLNQAFSMDGALSVIGLRFLKGASLASSRAEELSNHLARAPHVAGFLKMLMIGFFPILIFFLASGRWKPLVWWWLTYLSLCLWNPLWSLLYHVMTNLTLTLEVLESFGRLSDGMSLYSATIISSRLYQAFAAYSYLQLLIGPIFTGMLLSCMRPVLNDRQGDSMPSGITDAAHLATKAAGAFL